MLQKQNHFGMFVTVLFIFTLITALSPAPAPAEAKKLIYVVDSYNPETFSWTVEINDGIIKGLEAAGLKQGTDYEIVSDTMDAFVKAAEAEKEAEGRRILKDIQARKPDIVVCTDDDALAFVGLKLDTVPVVFNGVNGDPARYLTSPKLDSLEKPGHNITGVYQTSYFAQSLELIRRISPSAKTFAVISDTTITGKALEAALESVKNTLPMKWTKTLMSDSFPEWQKTILAWQNEVDAIMVLSANAVHDENKQLMTNDQTVKWIADSSRLPDTASWAFQVKPGILLSATDDGGMQGEFTAIHIAEIMKGTDPGDLPIVTPPNGVPALNAKRAEKMGLALPQDLIEDLLNSGNIFE